jgi:hypothetical protein
MAALAIFPGILPFVRLLLGIPAFLVNRRVDAWQNKASRLVLGLGVVLTVVMAARRGRSCTRSYATGTIRTRRKSWSSPASRARCSRRCTSCVKEVMSSA